MPTKRFLISFVILQGMLVGISSALKCWECQSDMNWDKCKMLQTKDCTWPQTRCGKFYTKQGAIETYRRDCFTEEFCTVMPQCTSQFSKCDITCCTGEACNGGTQKTLGLYLYLLLVLSTLFAILI